MNEANRLKLARIVDRYRPRSRIAVEDAPFVASFTAATRETLEPVMREVRDQLAALGALSEVERGETGGLPWVRLVILPADGDRTRRGVALEVSHRLTGPGLDVLAKLEASGKVVDVERFDRVQELRAEVVERIVVEGIEHLLASANTGRGAMHDV